MPLDGDPYADQFVEAALPSVHAAGSPYIDWFFQGWADARTALRSWMIRPSSEIFVGRATLLIARDTIVGGFIALGGTELRRCRQADAVASITLAGSGGRSTVVERVQLSRELFPPVAHDEFYLSKMWVSPDARGSGYGTTLMRRYVDVGTRNGFTRFRLDVWSGNHAAVRLYHRFGFEMIQESVSDTAAMTYLSMTAHGQVSLSR